MGALADAHGLRQGIKYRGPIKEALEKALVLQPSYLDGSPDRALGRWYFKVPGLFGGDDRKSESHLRKALGYKPDSIISLLFLAETLIELDQRTEARTVLQSAIDAVPDPEWAPEDARFKVQARTAARVAEALTPERRRGTGRPRPVSRCRSRGRSSCRGGRPAPCASGAAAARSGSRGTRRT